MRGKRRRSAVVTLAAGAVFALLVAAVLICRQQLWGQKRALAPPAIAVLPFVDLSPGKTQEYISDGIAEELLNHLSRVEGLRVVGRTSSFSFKGRGGDLREIAQALHVDSILEGSVRTSGNRMRITAHLVEAGSGYDLWSRAFELDMTDVFSVQDRIVKEVVDALSVQLVQRVALAPERKPRDPEAYRNLLMGREFERSGDFPRAEVAYRKALSLDGDYAPAWAELALSLYNQSKNVQDLRRALSAAEKAVALDPELSVGYEARGYVRMHLWDWSGSRADCERVLALLPNNARAHAIYGGLLRRLGNFDEGIRHLRRATELDPLSFYYWGGLGDALLDVGQIDSGRDAISRAFQLAPGDSLTQVSIAESFLLEHQPQAALAEAEKLVDEVSRLQFVAMAQHDLGDERKSQMTIDTLISKFGDAWPFSIAEALAWRGQSDLAFEWLERAYGQHQGDLGSILRSPFLRSLRADVRFKTLTAKMGLPAAG